MAILEYHTFLHHSLFNSHPHKEDDLRIASPIAEEVSFQLTSSQGGWPQHLHLRQKMNVLFNSHPHKEDDDKAYSIDHYINFSTHILTRRMTSCCVGCSYGCNFFNSHPHKEDDLGLHTYRRHNMLFNSHPHKEDDNDLPEPGVPLYFSTHILTRRMTIACTSKLACAFFQLTSSQGGWPSRPILHSKACFFNSHPHKEDDGSWGKSFCGRCFSTHILTRRMTNEVLQTPATSFFQLTSSQGGWRHGRVWQGKVLLFNSHPHKEDDGSGRRLDMIECFSTHILTRRMTIGIVPFMHDSNFQLTSSQGGWLCCALWKSGLLFFQLTSSQGGWRYVEALPPTDLTFQLTSSQGEWRCMICLWMTWSTFQLTSSQGGWHFPECAWSNRRLFNSHPHKEDDHNSCTNTWKWTFSTHILTRRMTTINCWN